MAVLATQRAPLCFFVFLLGMGSFLWALLTWGLGFRATQRASFTWRIMGHSNQGKGISTLIGGVNVKIRIPTFSTDLVAESHDPLSTE